MPIYFRLPRIKQKDHQTTISDSKHPQDMLMNLEGFQYATSLDLNMGYYHLELDLQSKRLCTIVLPFGKFQCTIKTNNLGWSDKIKNIIYDGISSLRSWYLPASLTGGWRQGHHSQFQCSIQESTIHDLLQM